MGVSNVDTGTDWFRKLKLRGYKFVNWYKGMVHKGGGHSEDENQELYLKKEAIASNEIKSRYNLERWENNQPS